nr:MAG TPA: TolA binding protein trimerization [Caudoviricetes sp.]
MTKSEINQKLAELRAQGEALQQNNSQIMQQLELNKVELAKICGKIELLSDMLSELEKPPVEGENGEAEKNANEKDNG